MTQQAPVRDAWSSRLGFILAAAGSAIGLGNIWKFPYITYDNGGGSFVLVYLACICLIGFPIMISEILIGRRTSLSTVSAFLKLAPTRAWGLIGALGVAGGFVILSYYSVVAGWTVYYFGQCLKWSTGGFTTEDADNLGSHFGAFVTDPTMQIAFHGAFMLVTILVVSRGIRAGIERVTKALMPVLILILLMLCVNSVRTPGFSDAMKFLFSPGAIDMDGVLEALGHAFFTLSLGMGAMITYGSYMGKKDSIVKSAMQVCFLDTVIAIMACVIMFSIIFGVDDRSQFSKSAAILFTTLPRMFYELPAGALLSPIFYLLVSLAALTSTISLLEVVVAYFIDQLGWSRFKSAVTMGLVIFSFGVLCALSNGANDTLTTIPLADKATGVFDIFDYIATNWMLPIGGLGIAVFVGWVLPSKVTREELTDDGREFGGYGLWQFLVRFVCPLAIAVLLFVIIFMDRKFN